VNSRDTWVVLLNQMRRLEQVIILLVYYGDHPCCLRLLGLLIALVLGLGLVLGFALIPTIDSFLLCREC
jgi:hypothetical protein